LQKLLKVYSDPCLHRRIEEWHPNWQDLVNSLLSHGTLVMQVPLTHDEPFSIPVLIVGRLYMVIYWCRLYCLLGGSSFLSGRFSFSNMF
jgi:hypothetical protein